MIIIMHLYPWAEEPKRRSYSYQHAQKLELLEQHILMPTARHSPPTQ